MGSYALIENGKVINNIVWDGPEVSPVDFGEGVTYAVIPDGLPVSMGWGYENGEFIAPPAPEPTREEIIAIAESERQGRLYNARQIFNIWQTKLLLNRATEEEKEVLNEWVDYFDVLSQMDVSAAPDIVWPEQPPIPEGAQ